MVCAWVGCGQHAERRSQALVYSVKRAQETIVIDGIAAESSWKRAQQGRAFVAASGGPSHVQETRARLLWDSKHLYAFLTLKDIDIYSDYHKQDDPLWKQDVVELFIDADGNGRGYIELQVNPHNAQLDSWFRTTRKQRGDVAWSAGMSSAVHVRGTLDRRNDRDVGWDVELAIPLQAVLGRERDTAVRVPPHIGDQWRMNIVRGDKPIRGRYVASSWSPIPYSDFHALQQMLTIVFAE